MTANNGPAADLTNYRDKETLIKAYDQEGKIQFTWIIHDRWGF